MTLDKEPLPSLSHLQFVVLDALLQRERRGHDIRQALRAAGVHRTLAAFYQLMARLEDCGHVEGCYRRSVVDGQPVKERWYKLTPQGAAAWKGSCDFYARRWRAGRRVEGLATG